MRHPLEIHLHLHLLMLMEAMYRESGFVIWTHAALGDIIEVCSLYASLYNSKSCDHMVLWKWTRSILQVTCWWS